VLPVIRLSPMAESRLYKTAHYNYRNTTRPYPLIPQVMNGTGALRQFVPRSLGIAPGRPLAIGPRHSLTIRDAEIFTATSDLGPGKACPYLPRGPRMGFGTLLPQKRTQPDHVVMSETCQERP
jgi:hypothetical protein